MVPHILSNVKKFFDDPIVIIMEELIAQANESGELSSMLDPVSIGIMLVMGVVGLGYWRYWKSTQEQKYLYVAIVLMAFPYISDTPIHMVVASIISIVVVHYVLD